MYHPLGKDRKPGETIPGEHASVIICGKCPAGIGASREAPRILEFHLPTLWAYFSHYGLILWNQRAVQENYASPNCGLI